MKKVAFFVFFLILCGCGSDESEFITEGGVSKTEINQLWGFTVSELLSDDLWLKNYKYDASHVLMLPMHYAFVKNDSVKKLEFDTFFERATLFLDEWNKSGTLYDTQFSYFVSRYLYLSKVSGEWQWFHQRIYEHLLSYSKKLWYEEQAWHWSEDYFIGFKERMYWKIENQNTEYKFYQAIVDEEFFLLGMSAELSKIVTLEDDKKGNEFLSEVTGLFYKLFSEHLGRGDDGFWYFQKGVWFDHPTHLYSGHTVLEAYLEPLPDESGVYDSSHSHRLPLILISFIEEAVNSKDLNKSKYYFK